jgi:hypothetical protein
MKKADEIFDLNILVKQCREAMRNINASPEDYRGEFGGDYAEYVVCVIASEYHGTYIPAVVAEVFDMTPTDFDDDLVYDEELDAWVDLLHASVNFTREDVAILSCEFVYDTIEEEGGKLAEEINLYLKENHPDIPGLVTIGFDHNRAFSVIYLQEVVEEDEDEEE